MKVKALIDSLLESCSKNPLFSDYNVIVEGGNLNEVFTDDPRKEVTLFPESEPDFADRSGEYDNQDDEDMPF